MPVPTLKLSVLQVGVEVGQGGSAGLEGVRGHVNLLEVLLLEDGASRKVVLVLTANSFRFLYRLPGYR